MMSLIAHGIPNEFPSNKVGMKSYYIKLWRAFPEANFSFDHVIVEGNDLHVMFSSCHFSSDKIVSIPSLIPPNLI